MKGKILITDTLFMHEKHVSRLEKAGYEVTRLEKADATEAELIKAVQDMDGYIMGGVEHITEPVIEAANNLKAIVFSGTGYQTHIPGWQAAKDKGVAIANSPYANVYEVAEWALAATLAMQRNLFGLGPRGTQSFVTSASLPETSVGIIGLGHIGAQYADMVSKLGAKEVLYWNRSKKDTEYTAMDLEELLGAADVLFLAVGDEAGHDFLTERELALMKQDALIVSIAHDHIINEDALYEAVKSGRIRAALDCISDFDRFKNLPADRWYGSNGSAAYNTMSFLVRASDMATETIINLLETGEDQYRVV
jgi:D-3-phosphoglycerate dehydrogenase